MRPLKKIVVLAIVLFCVPLVSKAQGPVSVVVGIPLGSGSTSLGNGLVLIPHPGNLDFSGYSNSSDLGCPVDSWHYSAKWEMIDGNSVCMVPDGDDQEEQACNQNSYSCTKAMPSTHYVWEGETRLSDSTCYRVDNETNGQKFHQKVENQNTGECTKLMPPTHYVWESFSGGGGLCYRVDNETNGQKFNQSLEQEQSDKNIECQKAQGVYVSKEQWVSGEFEKILHEVGIGSKSSSSSASGQAN